MHSVSSSQITSLKNILTLRYDPTMTTYLSKITWRDFTESSSYSVEHVESLIENSLRHFSSSVSDNHYAIGLSGGVDSAIIIAMLRKVFPEAKIDAISVRFADSLDESDIATKIGNHFDANVHVVSVENYLAALPETISIIGYPFWDSHWYYVVKKAKDLSKVLLSGDGGDELFGGYTFRYEKFLAKYSHGMSYLEKTKLYLDCHERDWVPDQKSIFGEKIGFDWNSIYQQISSSFDNSLSPLNQIFLADFNGKLLYNWIPLNKRLHDHFGVTSFSPLLSSEMISYATHLPSSVKYDQRTKIGKIPLRSLLNRYIPKDLISDEKYGFSVNTINLWKKHGRELCEQYLLAGRTVEDGLLDRKWLETKLKKLETEQDVRYVNKFIGLLALEVWYRLFITKEMKANTILK